MHLWSTVTHVSSATDLGWAPAHVGGSAGYRQGCLSLPHMDSSFSQPRLVHMEVARFLERQLTGMVLLLFPLDRARHGKSRGTKRKGVKRTHTTS